MERAGSSRNSGHTDFVRIRLKSMCVPISDPASDFATYLSRMIVTSFGLCGPEPQVFWRFVALANSQQMSFTFVSRNMYGCKSASITVLNGSAPRSVEAESRTQTICLKWPRKSVFVLEFVLARIRNPPLFLFSHWRPFLPNADRGD